MTNKYSLADYIVTISIPAIDGSAPRTINIGGPGDNQDGSFVGEIKVTRTSDLWTTKGDNTGSWVHNKNLDRSGTVTINLNQISDSVIQLMQLCITLEKSKVDPITIGVAPAVANGVTSSFVECYDCYLAKISDQTFGNSAQDQTWTFNVGRVTFDVM